MFCEKCGSLCLEVEKRTIQLQEQWFATIITFKCVKCGYEFVEEF